MRSLWAHEILGEPDLQTIDSWYWPITIFFLTLLLFVQPLISLFIHSFTLSLVCFFMKNKLLWSRYQLRQLEVKMTKTVSLLAERRHSFGCICIEIYHANSHNWEYNPETKDTILSSNCWDQSHVEVTVELNVEEGKNFFFNLNVLFIKSVRIEKTFLKEIKMESIL